MKSLKTIQILSKIGKVLSTIAYIFNMIGMIGGIVGIVLLSIFGEKAFVGIQDAAKDLDDASALQSVEKISIPMLSTTIAVAILFCIAGVIIAARAKRYFKNELEDGTPFTLRGAKELKSLGILYIALHLGVSVIAAIAVEIIGKYVEGLGDINYSDGSIGLGIAFLVVSVICKLGAEMTEKKEAPSAE